MDTDTLLINYLLGETTEEQTAEAIAWIEDSEENRKHFLQMEKIWHLSQQMPPVASNVEAAWQSFQQSISTSKKSSKVLRFRYWKIAAAIIVAAGIASIGLLLTKRQTTPEQPMLKATRSGTSFLPDGSVVTLSQQSTIFYPAVFTEPIRKVRFKGEGFFNVKHVAGKPFVIDVNDIQIKVLGTSFLVRSSPAQTDVEVKTGQVRIFHKEDSVLLDQGEMISVHPDDTKLFAKLILDFKTAQLMQVIQKNGKMGLLNERIANIEDRKKFKDSLDKAFTNEGIKPLPENIQDLFRAVKKAGGDSIKFGDITMDSFVRRMIANGQVVFSTPADTSHLETKQQKDVIKNIIRDMMAEKIVIGAFEVESFALTDKEFVVNGKVQSGSLLEKFKHKYIPRPDYGIFYGSEKISTSEGFHFDRVNL